MAISLELAESMLTKFDGTKSKLFEFVDNCDKVNKLVKFEHKPVLFIIIQTKLTGQARHSVQNKSFETWGSLRKHLIEVYLEDRPMERFQWELKSCKHQYPGESVSSYSKRIERCYQCFTASINIPLSQMARNAICYIANKKAKERFIRGLEGRILIPVASQRPGTLEDAIALALYQERKLKSERSIYQSLSRFSRDCTNWVKAGFGLFRKRQKKQQAILID